MTRLASAMLIGTLGLLSALGQERPQNGVVQIEKRFIAPCCWNESVATHRSEIAAEMRAEIAKWVAAGRSESEIVDRYVAKYGERILITPRGNRAIVLDAVPWVVTLIAVAGLCWFLMTLHRRSMRLSSP